MNVNLPLVLAQLVHFHFILMKESVNFAPQFLNALTVMPQTQMVYVHCVMRGLNCFLEHVQILFVLILWRIVRLVQIRFVPNATPFII